MKKIEYAVGAAGLFIYHLHQENFDRGMVATFGNSFRIDQGFTSTESYLHSALGRIGRSVTDERTRLYDSIEDTIAEFWRAGDRSRPWLLTIITDGQDNESRTYSHQDWRSPERIGRTIAQRFNHEPSNFPFLIGVGEGNQIDRRALGAIGDHGGFPAITIAAFPLLEMVFLRIAINVSTELIGRRIDVGNLSWEQVAQIRRTSRIPIDYAFLIDRSGSMSEPG
jgi:Mg-chelatase subunit ChlD